MTLVFYAYVICKQKYNIVILYLYEIINYYFEYHLYLLFFNYASWILIQFVLYVNEMHSDVC